MQWIIYTDLDGTLLDFTDYSFTVAQPAVKALQEKSVPLIFCSSKTRVEQEHYRDALAIHAPFIVENGSAILIPKNYFSFDLPDVLKEQRVEEGEKYWQVILGADRAYILSEIEKARRSSEIDLWGYADLPLQEIMEITHLNEEFASRAATRDFSETLLKGDKTSEAFLKFTSILQENGLVCISGGKFHTVMGERSDKGAAVRVLSDLFRREFGEIRTVGLGDSANDLPLLDAVDVPFLVQKPGGGWFKTKNERIIKVASVGPEGWVKAVQSIGAI